MSNLDSWIVVANGALRTLSGSTRAVRELPQPAAGYDQPLSEADRREAGALMRVNHVGEVCAQALYQAQALMTQDDGVRRHLAEAAREEGDHLAWTEKRLRELGAHRSWLNPLWYAGAFAMGLVAGRAGERRSLGFVVETERQVEQHLASHLSRLPANDHASRVIVEQMKADEARHASMAEAAGGSAMPAPVRWAMRAAAKVMTTTAHRI